MFLTEEGSERARELWELESGLVSSWITYAETGAALASARRSRRLSRRAASIAARRLQGDWEAVEAIVVDELTAEAAGTLADRHELHGMDAIHLASAIVVAEARPVMVTWDAELRRAASAEGLDVLA